jgi:hypothetical protein
MGFGIVAYDDNGIAGQPGTFLGGKSAAVSIPTSFGQTIVDVACSELGLTVSSGSVYIGAQWNAGSNADFFICTDESIGTPQRVTYRSGNGGVSWTSISQDVPATKALGVRAELVAFNPNACVPDGDTLCLNNGRFKVEATFNTNTQQGVAQVVKLTDETGYMFFFNAANVEAVVKVLNACFINGAYWVFAGGLTDQGVVLTVTDTVTLQSKTYTNPRGRVWVTITDTIGLPVCP